MKELAKKLIEAQKKYKELESAASAQKKLLTNLKEMMLTEMNAIGTLTYKGEHGTLSIRESIQPTVEDWNELYDYILQYGALDLLQKRISSTAFRDRLEDGEIPGMGSFTKQTMIVKIK